MNIAIVDDIAKEIDSLEEILKDYAAIHAIPLTISHFSGGEAFLENYVPFQYTAIFLDIYMDGITGIRTAERVREQDPETLILFLTTSIEHMQSAFSIHAYDYIEKPANKDRLFHVMDDILKKETKDSSARLSFSHNKQSYSLPCSRIQAVCTDKTNYLTITDSDGTQYHPRMTFGSVSDLLENEPSFLLINRGVFVNMDYIDHFAAGICYLQDDLNYRVFTKKAKETEQIYQNYTFTQMRNSSRRHRETI